MRRRALLAGALGGALSVGSRAHAQTPHERVQDALVMVKINGTREADREPDSSTGTGFFVNGEGLLFTSHHLRADKRFIPGTEEYFIRRVLPGGLLTNDQRVEYFDHDEKNDILALWSPTYGRPVPFLPVAPVPASLVVPNETLLFVSGYPPEAYQAASGHATSLNGPPPNLWLWTINFDTIPGLSGAPVYLADGRVIALMKGANRINRGIAYVVPSNLWSTTLVNLNAINPYETSHVLVYGENFFGPREVLFEGRVSAERGAVLDQGILGENVIIEVHSVDGLVQSTPLQLGQIGELTISRNNSGGVSVLSAQ